MAEIRNSLRPFEESSGQPNGQVVNGGQLLGAGSGRPLSSLSYNECIQALVNLGFDEVGCHTHSTFFLRRTHINMMKCVIWWGIFYLFADGSLKKLLDIRRRHSNDGVLLYTYVICYSHANI